MGKAIHMAQIFPHLHFPNVQLKPRRSTLDVHKYQVESKVAGIGHANADLKSRRLLIGTAFTSLTSASLASNFLICILNKVKVHLKDVLKVSEKDIKPPVRLIEVPHIRFADLNPLLWYESYNKGIISGCKMEDMSLGQWELQIVQSLLHSLESFTSANVEIAYHAKKYGACLFGVNNFDGKSYVDPPEWLGPLNAYLDEGSFLEPKETTKKVADRKIIDHEDIIDSHILAPRITAVGGGPKTMSLVYHLCFDGNEVCSPCFFNKNFFKFSRIEKILNAASKNFEECETHSKIGNHLKRIMINARRDYNYYSGTFEVDYYRNEGIKPMPWDKAQPIITSNKKYNIPMSTSNISNMQWLERDMNVFPSEDASMEDYENELEDILSVEEDSENEFDYQDDVIN